jgi:hypothetical protein
MAHVEALASDPTRKQEVAAAMQVLNLVREAVENIGKQMAAEAQRNPQTAGMDLDPKTASKLREAQVNSQIRLQQAQLDQQLRAAEAEQKMAIRDAEAAQKITQKRLA